jgi:proteasome lid subunit RPN8/RPN11
MKRSIRLPRRQPQTEIDNRPVLRFAPTAWAKLLYFRDRGESEIGGFGITLADDLLRIEEFCTVRHQTSIATIVFDDLAVADFFEAQVDRGRAPAQFARIWLHTHPGTSPLPSGTDEETFERVFGRCDWAVMFIIARGGRCYARLRFNTGPGGQLEIPVAVDYRLAFGPSAQEAWEAEYLANVDFDARLQIGLLQGPFLEDELWGEQAFSDDWPSDQRAFLSEEREARDER